MELVKRLCATLFLIAFVVGLTFAGAEKAAKVAKVQDPPVNDAVSVTVTPDHPATNPLVGTYTGLSGFWDYQTNGACEFIRVNPANGNIHAIMQVGIDSANVSAGRRTAYAFSSDGGVSWNTFNDLLVPNRRSGYPSIDIAQGAIAGAAIVANHSTITTLQSTAFVDYPEGSGAFAEIGAPSGIEGAPGADEPSWPMVAGAADGSITMVASRSVAVTAQLTRTADYSSWAAWTPIPDSQTNAQQYPTIANGTGRVGTTIIPGQNGVWWLESTDNGVTWPAHTQKIFDPAPVGPDSLTNWLMGDCVYQGNNPLITFTVTRLSPDAAYLYAGSRIMFWSQATGLVTAVPWDSTKYLSTSNASQNRHLTVDYPAIGLSGNTIVIAFVVMQADTSAAGFNFFDVYEVHSANGGASWSTPVNLTNTPNMDERYPSISKWNAPGQANIVWQEDTQPGASIPGIADAAPLSRSRQVFYRYNIPATGVEDKGTVPGSFSLGQNYPNPFNPATTIEYTVSKSGPVSIKVYNTIGQEVATLVNEIREVGHYQVVFDGSSLASGMYIYRMQAGNFVESKRMLFLK